MMSENNIKFCITYWCKRYKENCKKHGAYSLAAAYARASALAFIYAYYGDKKVIKAFQSSSIPKKLHYGHGKRFRNTWLGKLLGFKYK